MSKTVKIVLSVVGGVLVIACAGGAYGYYQIKKVADDAVPADTYAHIKKGDSQDTVRKQIGGNHDIAKRVVKGSQPAAPAGSTCDYALSKSFDHAYRFCYVGGKLVQKDELQISDDKTK